MKFKTQLHSHGSHILQDFQSHLQCEWLRDRTAQCWALSGLSSCASQPPLSLHHQLWHLHLLFLQEVPGRHTLVTEGNQTWVFRDGFTSAFNHRTQQTQHAGKSWFLHYSVWPGEMKTCATASCRKSTLATSGFQTVCPFQSPAVLVLPLTAFWGLFSMFREHGSVFIIRYANHEWESNCVANKQIIFIKTSINWGWGMI